MHEVGAVDVVEKENESTAIKPSTSQNTTLLKAHTWSVNLIDCW